MLQKMKKFFTYDDFSIFFKINLLLSSILFSLFMLHNNEYSLVSFFLLLIASISSAAILYILIYILLAPFFALRKSLLYVSAFVFTTTNIALVVDFFIFRVYKFHINAMVLNILTSPDAFDSIQIGTMPIVVFLLTIFSFIAFEIFLIKKLLKISTEKKEKINQKANKLIVLPLFLIILTEKLSYGFLTLTQDTTLVTKFKVIPLYQPLTFNRLAIKVFGYKPKEQTENRILTDALLNYPLKELEIPKTTKKFNIIIIASDAVRNSNINSENSPNIELFKRDSIVFDHHYTGGNATRFGIFSLFYGLNSTYWFAFYNANRGAVLFDVLKEMNYNIKIVSSTSTSWPEFRKTAYVNIQDSIKDDFDGSPWEKDEQSTQYLLETLDQYDSDKPLFSFLFLDAPHGYVFPDYADKFNASKENINYLTVSKDSKENEAVYARYKNAIYFNDMMFQKIISKLKEKNMYDNSLIIYTSDHGEEFYEYGYFGHTTAFSEAQMHTPFIVKLPESLKADINLSKNYPEIMTSHIDLVPTLLNLLGVKNESSEYSNGYNIFDASFKREYIFGANWNNNAVITPKNTYVFSNLPNKMFRNEVRDTQTYKIKEDATQIENQVLLKIMDENRKFLK